MGKQWYYYSSGERQGPVSDSELKALADRGELQPDDLVWTEGLGDWQPAKVVKGLFSVKSAEPPPLPKMTEPPPLPIPRTLGNALPRNESTSSVKQTQHPTKIELSSHSIAPMPQSIVPNVPLPYHSQPTVPGIPPHYSSQRPDESESAKIALLIMGYVCACISLCLCPPAFAIAGVVIGIINVTRQREGHGIAQIILSLVLGTAGLILGLMANGLE
jgi:hypothetical protein